MVCKNIKCAVEFTPRKSGGRTQKFCSTKCENRWNRDRRRKEMGDEAYLSKNAAYRRQHYAAHPGSTKENNLRKFNITPQQYDEMLAKQNGGCAICGRKNNQLKKGREDSFCVDHDHQCCAGTRSCGSCIRGLLCHACNQAIGLLKDSTKILDAAKIYLERTA
jgi:hypothetical protein